MSLFNLVSAASLIVIPFFLSSTNAKAAEAHQLDTIGNRIEILPKAEDVFRIESYRIDRDILESRDYFIPASDNYEVTSDANGSPGIKANGFVYDGFNSGNPFLVMAEPGSSSLWASLPSASAPQFVMFSNSWDTWRGNAAAVRSQNAILNSVAAFAIPMRFEPDEVSQLFVRVNLKVKASTNQFSFFKGSDFGCGGSSAEMAACLNSKKDTIINSVGWNLATQQRIPRITVRIPCDADRYGHGFEHRGGPYGEPEGPQPLAFLGAQEMDPFPVNTIDSPERDISISVSTPLMNIAKACPKIYFREKIQGRNQAKIEVEVSDGIASVVFKSIEFLKSTP